MSFWRDMVRGCGNMPYVGPHPGTATVVVGIAIAAAAGGPKASLIVAGIFVPIYLYGALERARFSDQLQREANHD